MKRFPRKFIYLRSLVYSLVLCVVALPLMSSVPLAAETQVVPIVLHAEDNKEVEAHSDRTKEVASESSALEEGATETETPVLTEQKKTPKTAEKAAETETTIPGKTPEETKQEGMSTLTKVGIGVGAAAVVGVALALGGGSSDDGPEFPTVEGMVGAWHGRGTSQRDRRTYDGVYTFYLGGSHTYDITVSDGEVRRGRGNWELVLGTNLLRVRNDTGSVYEGQFIDKNFTSINMTTADGSWQLVLTKM